MKRVLKHAALIAGVLSAMLWVAEYAGAGPLVRAKLTAQVPTVVSYQGHVRWDGSSYDGAGYFKFAVVDALGTTSYWSNDGTSNRGGQPDSATPLTVAGGLFTVLLGDPAHTNMTQPLEAAVFGGDDRYLRVWFSTDNTTFTLLSPDRRIAAVPYALQAEEAANAGALGGQEGSYYQDATNLNAGTLATDRYSAYADLAAEGRLNNNDGMDLLTRTQADGRYSRSIIGTGTSSVTAGPTQTFNETSLGSSDGTYCWLRGVEFFGINRDEGARCRLEDLGGNWWLAAEHNDDADASVTCSAYCVSLGND